MKDNDTETVPKKVCLSAIRDFERLTGLSHVEETLVKRGLIVVVNDDKS